MRPAALFAFVLAWVCCCVGCGTQVDPKTPRELAAHVEALTVALVARDHAGNPQPFCAGVWVSQSEVLTAGHCVELLAETPERRIAEALLEQLGADEDELPPPDPTGYETLVLPEDAPRYWRGRVVAWDHGLDLGLVVVPNTYVHPFARLADGVITVGDRVEFAGHPMGNSWAYAEGYVSRVWTARRNPEHVDEALLLVAGPFSKGDSGCGAFDPAGRLLGLGVFYEGDVNGLGFFVHRDVLRGFLAGARP